MAENKAHIATAMRGPTANSPNSHSRKPSSGGQSFAVSPRRNKSDGNISLAYSHARNGSTGTINFTTSHSRNGSHGNISLASSHTRNGSNGSTGTINFANSLPSSSASSAHTRVGSDDEGWTNYKLDTHHLHDKLAELPEEREPRSPLRREPTSRFSVTPPPSGRAPPEKIAAILHQVPRSALNQLPLRDDISPPSTGVAKEESGSGVARCATSASMRPAVPHFYNGTTPLHGLSTEPAIILCPLCGIKSRTKTVRSTAERTVMSGLSPGKVHFCCSVFPWLYNKFSDVEHLCGSCGRSVAVKPYKGVTQTQAKAAMAEKQHVGYDMSRMRNPYLAPRNAPRPPPSAGSYR